MEREFARVVARLDALHRALADRPLDVELLAENPLQALRRRREEQRARGREWLAQNGADPS